MIEAMYAGKDVYCEPPLTVTIDEGKQIRKAQKETGRIVQLGTQQRSTYRLFTKAVAMVNEGRLGKLMRLQAAIGGAPVSGPIPVKPAPDKLDWDRWLGPAPRVDYRSKRPESGRGRTLCNAHYEFRWWYEYSGGKLTDWGAHHVDICNWALQVNGQTAGPVSISGTSEHPVEFDEMGNAKQNDRYNTATAFNFSMKYADGCELVMRNDTDNGALIEGTKGRIVVNRRRLVGAPVEALKDNPLPEAASQYDERKRFYADPDHVTAMGQWIWADGFQLTIDEEFIDEEFVVLQAHKQP